MKTRHPVKASQVLQASPMTATKEQRFVRHELPVDVDAVYGRSSAILLKNSFEVVSGGVLGVFKPSTK